MNRLTIPAFRINTAVLLAAGLLLIVACHKYSRQPAAGRPGSFKNTLIELQRKYNQPAMAAALVRGDSIVEEAATGTTVYGGDRRVDRESRFHIGSTTKSMTAVLVAMLVKEGKLKYDMTLEQALPGISMRDEYRRATIADVLNNKAGILAMQLTALEDPAVVKKLFEEIPAACSSATGQRREVAAFVLNLEPIAEPGTKVIYSNVGWAIAGHILETAAGQPYEDLLRERIFEPLGMNNAQIGGWPASGSEPDQPRGHFPGPDSTGLPVPQELDPEYRLSAWMNPSGGVHCTVHDLALYVREHLLGLNGKGILLGREDYETLHSVQVTTNLKDMYPQMKQDREASFGYGWGVFKQEKGFHSSAAGSGGTFFAQIVVDSARDYAFVGLTNCGNGGRALAELAKSVGGE